LIVRPLCHGFFVLSRSGIVKSLEFDFSSPSVPPVIKPGKLCSVPYLRALNNALSLVAAGSRTDRMLSGCGRFSMDFGRLLSPRPILGCCRLNDDYRVGLCKITLLPFSSGNALSFVLFCLPPSDRDLDSLSSFFEIKKIPFWMRSLLWLSETIGLRATC